MVINRRFGLDGINANALYDRLKQEYSITLEAEAADKKELFDSFEHLLWQNALVAEFSAKKNNFEIRDRITGELKGSKNVKPNSKFFAWDLGDLNSENQLDAIIGVRALIPQHRYSEFARQLAVRNADDKIVCRCRISEVTSAIVSSIVQISVSPLRGYSKDGDKICQWLTENCCTPATTGEFYKLITGFTDKQAYFNVKPVIPIKRETPAREAACKVINAMLSVADQTEEGVVADIDSEFLHDYRICMRKIRSVLSLMKGVFATEHNDSLKQAFRDIASETNRLRDLDVYLLEKQDLIDMLPSTLAGGLEAMFNDFAEQRRLEQKRIANILESSAYKQKMRRIKQLLATAERGGESDNSRKPVFEVARQEIRKHYKKINRIGRKITAGTPDKDVHQLRIECKKLRYLLEFYQPLLPQQHTQQFVKRLKKLQTCLGLFNDCATQQQSLLDYVSGSKAGRGQKEVALAVGGLVAILNQRQHAARNKVQSLFAEFDSKPTRESIKLMFDQKHQA